MALFVGNCGLEARRLSAKSFDLTILKGKRFGYLQNFKYIASYNATAFSTVVVSNMPKKISLSKGRKILKLKRYYHNIKYQID